MSGPSAAELSALIERVNKTSGPDQELDALIWAAFDGRDVRYENKMMLARSRRAPHDECVLGFVDPGKTRRNFRLAGEFIGGLHGSVKGCPEYTDSTDAVLALVEKMLPGWSYIIDARPVDRAEGNVRVRLYAPSLIAATFDPPVVRCSHAESHAATAALAILAALLHALKANADE
jgi:hypothetical protein